jgi:hypothetical protein
MHWHAPRQHRSTSTGVRPLSVPRRVSGSSISNVNFPLMGNRNPFFLLYGLNGSSYDDFNDAADGGEGTHREFVEDSIISHR